jgi:hypothetical protein
VPSTGFQPDIPAIKWPKTYAIKHAVTGIDHQPLLVIKSRTSRWADRVARMGKRINAYIVLGLKNKGKKDHVEGTDVYGI